MKRGRCDCCGDEDMLRKWGKGKYYCRPCMMDSPTEAEVRAMQETYERLFGFKPEVGEL